MSDEVAEKKSSVNKKGSYRKRRPQNRRTTEQHADGDNKTEIVVKREKVEMVPVPEELIGKPTEGTVVSVIRKGKYNFGFISLTTGNDFDDKTLPRIYFNPSCLVDSTVYLRRGYTVKFICGNDDEGRSVAKEIELTEEGKKVQVEREAIIAQKRSEKQLQQDQQPEKDTAATTSNKRRDTRKAKDYKTVSLKIQKEGSDIEKTIEFSLGQSIGKLKAIAMKELEAPIEYSVYQVTPDQPQGTFLTKSTLNQLKDNDVIRLAPKPESEAQ